MLITLQSDKKCFNIEQPRDTPVVFAYEILDAAHKITFDLYYGSVSTPDLQIVHKVFNVSICFENYMLNNDND